MVPLILVPVLSMSIPSLLKMTVPLPSKSSALPAPKASWVSGVPDGRAKRRLPSMMVRCTSVVPVGISRRVRRISF